MRYIIWLLDFLDTLGLDTHALCIHAGVDYARLKTNETLVTNEQHSTLLLTAQALYSGTDLGLLLGSQRSIATHDQLAYLMMSSATLRDASHAGLQYQNYSGRFSGNSLVTSFSELHEQGCYQIDTKDNLGELRLLAIEDILANIATTARWVLDRSLPLIKIRCNYPAPPHVDKYAALFQCPIEFDSPTTQILFEAFILDEPLPQASPQSVAFYQKLCEEKSASLHHGDIAWKLSQMIIENPAQPPSLEEAATRLHCSQRTLSRKLLAQGWRYQQLIDQIRKIHARRHLSDPNLTITQIGQQLGYADSSGFHRAFKKWTGLSPREYRKALFK